MSAQEINDGLTSKQAEHLLQVHGRNQLPESPLPGPLKLFLQQFLSPFIYILLLAAVISLALGQLSSGVFIVIVLLVNAVIGAVQEYSAQRAAAALKNMVKGVTRVIR